MKYKYIKSEDLEIGDVIQNYGIVTNIRKYPPMEIEQGLSTSGTIDVLYARKDGGLDSIPYKYDDFIPVKYKLKEILKEL